MKARRRIPRYLKHQAADYRPLIVAYRNGQPVRLQELDGLLGQGTGRGSAGRRPAPP